MIALTLNLECVVKSLVGQIVLCSKGGRLECGIVLIVNTYEVLVGCSAVLK